MKHSIGEFLNRVTVGDSLKLLPFLPENSVDTCITDPPYHLTQASRKGSPRKNDPKTPFGRHHIGDKGFMNQTWDGGDVAFSVVLWKEVYRILKPGATLLAFGGTRTHHRLMCAIEDAGFEIKDCITWVYGSGMPKSADVSKLIDKSGLQDGLHLKARIEMAKDIRACRMAKGMSQGDLAARFPQYSDVTKNWEREDAGFRIPSENDYKILVRDLGVSEKWRGLVRAEDKRRKMNTQYKDRREDNTVYGLGHNGCSYEATTDMAKQWIGYGTSLKPAFEIIVLAQKPMDYSYAMNAITWGVSGLNIDGTRVPTANGKPAYSYPDGPGGIYSHQYQEQNQNAKNWNSFSTVKDNEPSLGHVNGRWPSNLLLTHSKYCVYKGKKEVKGDKPHLVKSDKHSNTGYGNITVRRGDVVNKYADKKGRETVEDWECIDDCPIHILNRQGGYTQSGAMRREVDGYAGKSNTNFIRGRSGPSNQPRDAGFVSRFFQSFDFDSASSIYYCGKASRKEKTDDGRIANSHPTVKPLKLLEYLCILTKTPTGGIVLDPFLGSGSTGVACQNVGRKFIGIERSMNYAKIAQDRLKCGLLMFL